jgi:hypothetical protein
LIWWRIRDSSERVVAGERTPERSLKSTEPADPSWRTQNQ